MTVIALPPRNALPLDLPEQLRGLAIFVEKKVVTEMVIGMVYEGEHTFWYPSSKIDSLVLATLMHSECINRMRQ